MKPSVVIAALALTLSSNAFADSRQLLCEGDTNIIINPKKKTVHITDKSSEEFVKIDLSNFEILRNGPDTYRASGTVVLNEKQHKISVVTVWQPEKPLTANVSVGSQAVVLTCYNIMWPDLP